MPALTVISTTVSSIGLLFKTMDVAPKLVKLLGMYESAPSKADRKLLVSFAALVESRRVYHRSFELEVFEMCLGSLAHVKDEIEKTLTNITNPGAQAVLGALLDDHRKFIDKWHGHNTPHNLLQGWTRPGKPNDAQELAGFFDDLGELRARTQLWMGCLNEIEPTAKVPKFRRDEEV
jgi:hypothetical protein